MATISNPNAKATAGNGLGPQTRILSFTGDGGNHDQDSIDAIVLALTAGGTAGSSRS